MQGLFLWDEEHEKEGRYTKKSSWNRQGGADFSFRLTIIPHLLVYTLSFGRVENTVRSVPLISENWGHCSQPVKLTASQRSRNIFSYQLPGRLLCPQAWLHEIDWIRGNQEWRFSFYTSLTISFSSPSVLSGRNDSRWNCFNYYVD